MKLHFLLLVSIFYFLFSALLPSPSLATHLTDCSSNPTQGCSRKTQCKDPDTGKVLPTVPSEQCKELSTTMGEEFICCVYGHGTYNQSQPLCGAGNDKGKGINTAIGCLIAGDPKQLISQLLGWGVGVGGGIAFLMIVFAGFQIITAGGDPKLIQAGHELLISAISGLILIVLSVLILNLIGVNILKLPGFMDNTGLQL